MLREECTMESRPPLPPFTAATAAQKVRKFHWPLGRRPDDHASLSDLGL
jgi:nuclear transport factor 2 (NTF2) superfamily protein